MMASPAKYPARRRPIRWLVGLLLAVVLLVGGVNLILRIIPLKSIIEDALTKELGMPFVIGEFHPWAFPRAYITAHDISVGTGDYRYTAETMKVRGSLWRLARKIIDIEHAEIFGFRAYFPPTVDEAIDRWDAMIDHIGNKEKPVENEGAGWQLVWRHAEADGLHAFLDEVMALDGFLAIEDITFDTMHFDADLRMTALTGAPRVTGKASLTKGEEGGPSVLVGTAHVDGFRLNDFGLPPRVPELITVAEVSLDGPVPSNLAFGLSGVAVCPELPGLGAEFTAKAWMQNKRIILNDVDYHGEALHIRGDLTKEEDSALAFHVTGAEAQGDGLTALLAVLASRDAGIEARGDGKLTVRDFVFGSPPDAGLRLVRGEGQLEGINFVLPTGEAVFNGLSGGVHIDQGAVLLDNVSGEGVLLAGTITPNFDGGGVHVALQGELSLYPARFAPWMDVSVLPRLSGSLAVQEFTGTFDGELGLPGDFSVRAHMQGVSASYIAMEDEPPLEFDEVGGALTFSGNTLTLEDIEGKRFEVSGTVKSLSPGYAVDVAGRAQLDAGFIRMLAPASLTKLGGEVSLDRLAGTFTPEEPLPHDLVVQGAIKKGTAHLALAGYTFALSETAARFDSSDSRVKVTVERIASDLLGEISGTADYAAKTHALHAVLNLDANRLATLIESEEQREAIAPVFAALGASEVTMDLILPGPENAAWSATVVRTGSPPLTAKLDFDGAVPSTVDVTATLPALALAGYLPEAVKLAGTVEVQVSKSPGSPEFVIDAGLTEASLTLNEFVAKPVGGPAQFTVTGDMGSSTAAMRHAALTLYGEQVHILLDEAPRIDALDIDLGPLAPLLTKGGALRGQVTGSAGFTPPRADLKLADAAITLQSGATLEGINGWLGYEAGMFRCRDLRVLGADSDCTFNVDFTPGQWEARIEGDTLDLNALLLLIDAARSAITGEPPAQPEAAPVDDAPLEPLVVTQLPANPDAARGSAAIDLKTILYRRGRLDNVRAQLEVTGEAYTLREISATPYTGQVTGAVRIGRTTDPPWVDTKLRLADAEMRIVDEMLFPEPRNAHGIGNGTVDAGFYFTRFEHLMKSMTGKLELDLRQGSYGAMGNATRALAFLRALEVIRLKVPQLQDRGLTFDDSVLRMYAHEGTIALEQFDLASTSYQVTGVGLIDYRDEILDISFRVHLLELLTGVVSRVPLLGSAVDALTSVTDLVITGQGSPFEPKFIATPGIGPGNRQEREDSRQRVREAVEGALDLSGL
jgi:hypothetical protein